MGDDTTIWDGDTVTMLDLDLDLAQHIDGRISPGTPRIPMINMLAG